MNERKLSRRQLLKAAGALGAAAAMLDPTKVFADEGQGESEGGRVTWDLINVSGTPPFITITRGGKASATSTDGNHVVKAKITVTGHGTFPNRDKCSKHVTGGGSWEVTGTTESACFPGSGTYEVTELLSWHPAAGTFPSTFTDNTGDEGTPSSGLATLRVLYSPSGRRGTLTVSCHIPDPVATPACTFEGITASMDYEDFWQNEAATNGVAGDRTLFHVSSKGAD